MSGRFHAFVEALTVLTVMSSGIAAAPAHGAPCALPTAWHVAVEERGGLGHGATLVVSAPSCCGLRVGDVVRQANGARVARCADLEPVAAEALAKGLALLLAVDRDGALLAVAATTREDERRIVAGVPGEAALAAQPPPRPPAERAGEAAPAVAERPSAERAATASAEHAATTTERAPAPSARVAEPPPTPRPRRATPLPARDEAGPELRKRAATAAAALARVDDAAAVSVPLVVYERRLGDAEAAIAALEFGVAPAESAVHDFIEETVALHRTARDVRRAQLQALGQAAIDPRGAAADTLPYFSNSKVPDWVAAYPFLADAVLEPPHETHMIPGEASGRWNAARALELLWERARAASGELATWSRS